MNVRIIANPVSGAGRGLKRADALYAALKARGASAERFITSERGEAQAEAARPGADYVVAVGGDGSANEVANGLRGSGATLAILPIGTANVVARELRTPWNPEKLADLIMSGRTRLLDTGEVNGRIFLQSGGAGLDAAVVARVHARRGKRMGYWRYVQPILQTVWTYRFPPIRVLVDGSLFCEDAGYAVAGNCRFSAGAFPLTPEARFDDGLLDVCVFRGLALPRIAKLAIASWMPGFAQRRDVLYIKARHIVFEPASGAPVPFQIDGDPSGLLPATFEVRPASLRVAAP